LELEALTDFDNDRAPAPRQRERRCRARFSMPNQPRASGV